MLLDEEPALANTGKSTDLRFICDDADLDDTLSLIRFLIERGFEVGNPTVIWAAESGFDSVFKAMLENQKTLEHFEHEDVGLCIA